MCSLWQRGRKRKGRLKCISEVRQAHAHTYTFALNPINGKRDRERERKGFKFGFNCYFLPLPSSCCAPSLNGAWGHKSRLDIGRHCKVVRGEGEEETEDICGPADVRSPAGKTDCSDFLYCCCNSTLAVCLLSVATTSITQSAQVSAAVPLVLSGRSVVCCMPYTSRPRWAKMDYPGEIKPPLNGLPLLPGQWPPRRTMVGSTNSGSLFGHFFSTPNRQRLSRLLEHFFTLIPINGSIFTIYGAISRLRPD